MSNEELVAEIRAGATERMGELWEQVAGLVKWKAKQIMTILAGSNSRGVEFEDLFQSGYLAMVAAVDTYDPAAGGAFSTWLMYHLKNAFAYAIGYRTQKGRKEPLNTSVSLDTPLSDDADSDDLMDVIADPSGQAGLESAEAAIYRDQLREALEAALATLPEQSAEVLRQRHYQNMTLAEVGERQGVSTERARQIECRALRQLRKPGTACYLRPFYDFDFYLGAGLGAFRHSNMSIQERYLIIEEERKEREAQKRKQAEENYQRQLEELDRLLAET